MVHHLSISDEKKRHFPAMVYLDAKPAGIKGKHNFRVPNILIVTRQLRHACYVEKSFVSRDHQVFTRRRKMSQFSAGFKLEIQLEKLSKAGDQSCHPIGQLMSSLAKLIRSLACKKLPRVVTAHACTVCKREVRLIKFSPRTNPRISVQL